MTQNFERAKSRLSNIQTIQPLITALRTMSMGVWQMANKKISFMKKSEEDYNRILREILPHIAKKRQHKQEVMEVASSSVETIYLMIGSERGLCGRFNISMAENALAYIEQECCSTYQIWVMGTRLLREVVRRGVKVSWEKTLPASSLFTYQQSFAITQSILEQYEKYAFNRFVILNNQVVNAGLYRFTAKNLLPFEINHTSGKQKGSPHLWPPPIIETDPQGIYNQIMQHFITFSFHQTILQSAAAEHSTRYNLMQEASQNAEDIIEELVRVINAERKRKITEEMQELAVSAGLLEHD